MASIAPLLLLAALPFAHDPPPPVWNATGHRIVARIAWEDLTPAVRQRVAAILAQHPRYQADLLVGLPEGSDAEAVARHAFATAATWPDVVRAVTNPMHGTCDHPIWHYVDLPILRDGQPAPAEKASDKPGPQNILQALDHTLTELRGTGEAKDQAVALCWFLHLVGDLHQPLHACTFVSKQYPNGDQGGNAQQILREPLFPNSQVSLHRLWDELPGAYQTDDADGYLAAGMRQDPRLLRERFQKELGATAFKTWAEESHELAIRHVYLDGNLATLSKEETKGSDRKVAPGVPPGYMAQAERLAMQRLALAGYRLADQLNKVYGAAPAAGH